MANAKKIGGLGKGLNALFPQGQEAGQDVSAEAGSQLVPLQSIIANPYQPRRIFDEEKLEELAASIREHGVVQPIFVRVTEDGGYQVIAGERRVRAAKLAGLVEIPALIRSITEHEMMEISLIENIQRADLNPTEEARAYKRLSEEFGQTQAQIAARVSKSRSYIANSIRLLHLPDLILNHLAMGTLSIGHVRPLLTLNEQDALFLTDRLIRENGTARDAELWAKQIIEPVPDIAAPEQKLSENLPPLPQRKDPGKLLPVELKEIQRLLRETVNTKVEITHGQKGGKVIIDYYTRDDLEHILELITGNREI